MTGEASDNVERDLRVLIADERPARLAVEAGALEKHALNQMAFREVNERIAELTAEWRQTDVSLFVCECSDPGCAESLDITPAEYEWVRGDGARFVVVNGHQSPDGERVVEGNGSYLVVEKIGTAAAIARDSDPRHG